MNLPDTHKPPTPNLSGHHFRITCVQHEGYLDIIPTDDGTISFQGYLIRILEELARPNRGNFTYELLTPSGYGSKCAQRLTLGENTTTISDDPDAYHERNFGAFKCGESDVNDRPLSAYSTDMYWSSYYITPERLLVNKFTVPYSPPDRATLGMVGTATHIQDIPDLADRNHNLGYNVCAYDNTAYMDQLVLSFPSLDFIGISYSSDDTFEVLNDGTCDIIIASYPELSQLVLKLHKKDQCRANGKPVGVIGDPLDYGFNYFAFGIRDDLPLNVVQTLNFWMQELMACYPQDPHGACYTHAGGGSFSELYVNTGGTGQECGYVQFPPLPSQDTGLAPGVIVAIVLSPIVVLIALGMLYHTHQLKAQERRMKKRFIQQLARNIDIGPSAHSISVEKLSEAFQHIGGQDGMISKADLAKWMNDLHLDFLSERDFDRLWEAMDMDNKGLVDPIDFVTFLGECGPQFKEVYREYAALPKTERMKLATRRLTNLSTNGGLEAVQKMERRNNRMSRRNIVGGPVFSTTSVENSSD